MLPRPLLLWAVLSFVLVGSCFVLFGGCNVVLECRPGIYFPLQDEATAELKDGVRQGECCLIWIYLFGRVYDHAEFAAASLRHALVDKGGKSFSRITIEVHNSNDERMDVVPFHYFYGQVLTNILYVNVMTETCRFGTEQEHTTVVGELNDHIERLKTQENGFVFVEERPRQYIYVGSALWIIAGVLLLAMAYRPSQQTPAATRAERKKRIYKQH